jgi:outer membrane lipoprotein-sorting protein
MKHAVILLISFIMVTTGCSTLGQRTEEPPAQAISSEAQALFSRLQSQNSQLRTFKGTGRMRTRNRNASQQARIMWAGHQDGKLRLEVMGAVGQPVFSFASDGERIYLISHAENRFVSRRRPDANLEKLIALPITVPACLDLLAGRIPVVPGLLPVSVVDKDDHAMILVLKHPERNKGYERVVVDTSSGNVRQIEVFDADGDLDYRAEFVRMQTIAGFEVPRELRLSNGRQVDLGIVVERFWPNAAVADSLFVLTKPD